MPAGIAALAALLLIALAWPISALTRRYYRVPSALGVSDARARRRMRIIAVATVLAWAGWIALIVAMMKDITLFSPSTDFWVVALQVVGAIVFVGGTLVGLWAAATTLRGRRGALAKAWALLLAGALLVSLWIAIAFHALSFGVEY